MIVLFCGFYYTAFIKIFVFFMAFSGGTSSGAVSITSPMSMFCLFESIPMPGQSTVVTEKEQLSEVPAGRTTIKEKPTSGNEKQTERISQMPQVTFL